MISIDFVGDHSTNHEFHYFFLVEINVFQGDVLTVLGTQSILGNLEESLNLWIHESTIALLFFCIEFVLDHKGDKNSENTRVEVISKAHCSARHIASLPLFPWEGETNFFLLLILRDNNLMRWES